MTKPIEISRLDMSTAWLTVSEAAKWTNENKRTVVEHVSSFKTPNSRHICATRWQSKPLEEEVASRETSYVQVPGFYEYVRQPLYQMHWYVNFANGEVFAGYGDDFLAQDELQCLEHPILGSVREAIVEAENFKSLTVEDGVPTPILVTGVDRKCHLDTSNLYGRDFREALPQKVMDALSIIDPPTVSHIIAMEAPYARGPYSKDQIRYILTTAVAGFSAAKRESGNKSTTIHTGFWGCGAYGGNSELMALLQLLAARISGIGTLWFHSGSEMGYHHYKLAVERTIALDDKSELSEIIDIIHSIGYIWGVGNGT